MRLLFLWVALIAWAGDERAEAGQVASVNGTPISDREFRAAINALGPSAPMVAKDLEMRGRFLEHLIDHKLLYEQARKSKLENSEEFQARLERAKIQILAELYTEQYVNERTTEDKLEAYFKANKTEFVREELKVSHILLADERKANQVLKTALAPAADFKALAKKYSSDPSAALGGDLGWVSRGRMPEAFEQAIFSMKTRGVYPKLIKTTFGYHIVKVDDLRNDQNTFFPDMRSAVKERLTKSLRNQLVDSLRKSAKIEVSLPALEAMED